MITALIFAGGTGQRMKSTSKPKQFLQMRGKPIIIYTLEYFEEHPEVDNICIVCLEGWIEQLEKYIKKYGISKVKWLVKGGDTCHKSIFNGLLAIKKECDNNSIILIHDGVRPLISNELISENIQMVREKGNAITVEKALETVAETDDKRNIINVPDRNYMYMAKAPQSFYFHDIFQAYCRSIDDKIETIDSAHLMNIYGVKLNTVTSTPYNIKITTPSDFYICRAIMESRENTQIFGL